MLCNHDFQAVTTDNFDVFHKKSCLPKQLLSSTHCFAKFQGIPQSLSKNRAQDNFTCCKLNPVQSSRSKSTTCPSKGLLLRFQQESTVTTDGDAEKLGKYLWHGSDLL